jgi:hypothetical protein
MPEHDLRASTAVLVIEHAPGVYMALFGHGLPSPLVSNRQLLLDMVDVIGHDALREQDA